MLQLGKMEPLLQKLPDTSTRLRTYTIVLVLALFAGAGTGYFVVWAKAQKTTPPMGVTSSSISPNQAQQDTKTFKDFAEGVIQKKPPSKNGDYSEGTYLLIRPSAVPVALTSSVVDLSSYEGKKVKVYGESNKAVQAGWLMDVGRVDVLQ